MSFAKTLDFDSRTKTVAVLIACYNRIQTTKRCLVHLQKQKLGGCYKINTYVVDDGSSDGTGSMIISQFPEVTVIQGSGNLWWGGATRLAWEHASKTNPDYYLTLNDDLALHPNAIQSMLDASFRCGVKSLIVGPTECSKSGRISYTGRNKAAWPWQEDLWIPPGNEPIRCDMAVGNCLLVSSEVFRLVGMIDSQRFPHNFGDSALSLVASQFGISTFVAPSVVGVNEANSIHLNMPWHNRRLKFLETFRRCLAQKHYPPGPCFRWYLLRYGRVQAGFIFIGTYMKVILLIVRSRMQRLRSPDMKA
jgi:GT2 family glycosyltransferase